VGVGLSKGFALMGVFALPPRHVTSVNMVSLKYDPWVIAAPDLVDAWGEVMPFSPTKVDYMEIFSSLNSASFDSHM